MYIKQLYTNCLAQASYYVESNGSALIIDPLRDPEPYLLLAASRNAKIKYVLETHFHADFVSGHIDLSKQTGATIVYGEGARPNYPALVARDGQTFFLGKLKIKILHTPGHTLESCCYLLYNEDEQIHCVFTGDTLFIGDVGRPDLLSGNLSKEELASMLYDSLNNKIKTLPDGVIVYPGHGAGSACGKNIGKETVSTIGEQKIKNYALKDMTRERFVKVVCDKLPQPPAYFFKDAKINVNGYDEYDTVIGRELKALSTDDFEKAILAGATVIDTRDSDEFGTEFIKGSINIGLNGDFAIWMGTLIDFEKQVVLVAKKGREKESIERLARIGFEKVKGFLDGGLARWIIEKRIIDSLPFIEFEELIKMINSNRYILLDVRKPSETEKNGLINSTLLPLSELPSKVNELDKNRNYIVFCAGGYRSMIASSILKANGISQVYNLQGGIDLVLKKAPELVEVFQLN